MQIKIDLPVSSIYMEDDNSDYKTAESFLKQVELSVHHAQKSLKQMREMNLEREDSDSYSISVRVDSVEYNDETTFGGNPARVYIDITSD